MAPRHRFGLLAAASLTVASFAAAGSAAAQPDLVPLLNNPMNATVGVQNVGTSGAAPTQMTINCTKFGKADGGCPDAPGMGAYVDPAFPNRVVIDVPALSPGETYNHVLTFWNAIPWVPGTFVFDAEVDAGHDIAESNEANNTSQSSYTKLPDVGVAPRDPLPLTAKAPGAEPVRPRPAILDSTNIFQMKKSRTRPSEPAGPQRLAPKRPDEPAPLLLRSNGN